ncbi:fumarylacetoacetate hydrolase family protein [Paenibacillus sp. HN-1]|uniref:fumarylacetoacetate hydrolase family protein n=1 Tax=Paenibacillus TaxID=44249 RepID=UPI001CA9715F|nr:MULTISPECIES: fumarylacetoacetate hydrolase family protein [Paenibacillus]MBY9079151.1 fumarylacetoacetate hydrolase family protein [Paenibacillus sp. CGMCC 1.18879]MBY9086929.1 fumarylacetoacetate hydrolase family protein [Paenibacillus sinensis]
MKLLQYKSNGGIKLGVKTPEGIVDIEASAERAGVKAPSNMEEVIGNSAEALTQLGGLLAGSPVLLPEETVEFAPCVTRPRKIVCVGLNYKSHAEEAGFESVSVPVLFSKLDNTLSAHKETIAIPPGLLQIDYEAELVVVIGRRASRVAEEEALTCVFGYAAGNDLTARELQFRTTQWLLGKSLDGFGPVGPWIATADEIDPGSLDIECRVNGEVRQSSNTGNMIHSCAELVSYISQHLTLEPGDLIFTGTPEGVILGLPEEKRKWLQAGDKVEITIDGLGTLENTLG